MTGTVLSISGAKGGVGKTTTALNLGAASAGRGGQSVLVVEADLAMGDLPDFVRLDFDPEDDPSLHDVLAGREPTGSAIYGVSGELSVMPSGTSIEGYAAADSSALPGVVETVRESFDAVLLDTGAGVSRETLLPMAVADGVALVATPRVSAVRDARKTAELAAEVGGEMAGLVLTRTGTGNAPSPESIADFLGVDLLGAVPDDEAVPHSQDVGLPVITHAIESPAARAYWEVAGALSLAPAGGMPASRRGRQS